MTTSTLFRWRNDDKHAPIKMTSWQPWMSSEKLAALFMFIICMYNDWLPPIGHNLILDKTFHLHVCLCAVVCWLSLILLNFFKPDLFHYLPDPYTSMFQVEESDPDQIKSMDHGTRQSYIQTGEHNQESMANCKLRKQQKYLKQVKRNVSKFRRRSSKQFTTHNKERQFKQHNLHNEQNEYGPLCDRKQILLKDKTTLVEQLQLETERYDDMVVRFSKLEGYLKRFGLNVDELLKRRQNELLLSKEEDVLSYNFDCHSIVYDDLNNSECSDCILKDEQVTHNHNNNPSQK